MNRQFVVKMMQAKKLEYEALKEIMPEPVVKRVAKLENELMDLGKELFMTIISNPPKDGQAAEPASKSKTNKVTIE